MKLASESYTPPQFPPSLEWYEVTRGAAKAGELLAVFEILEHPTSKDYAFPTLPDPKLGDAGQSQVIAAGQDQGPTLPVPVGIRPTLSKYRWVGRSHIVRIDKSTEEILKLGATVGEPRQSLTCDFMPQNRGPFLGPA